MKRITTSISDEDAKYARLHNIKISHAIRAFIRDHRVHTNDPDAEPSTREMQQKINRIMENLQNMAEFIEKEGLTDKFINRVGF